MKFARDDDEMSDRPDVSIVVPVYRSADCLVALTAAINQALEEARLGYELILVNDGSPDRSWVVIESICRENPRVVGIDLRRNFGQDNAIITGLRVARGQAVAIMDDDLQHDPRDLPTMLTKLDEHGADVVYAQFHSKRQPAWKRLGSWFNGKVAEWVIEKPPGIYLSPFKVIRGDLANLLCLYDGPEPYIDGLIFQITARIAQVKVDHHERYAGRSNYTLARSIRVWARLATSFSIKPLRLVTFTGFLLAIMGLGLALVVIVYRLAMPERFELAVAGWASLMVAQLLTTATWMVFLGVLGEYSGRTYIAVCRKPQAAIHEVLNAGASGRRTSTSPHRGPSSLEA
jgi:undecaprenyl-phosphate 4-deoxy-4-formamido-L-arabinose transferase